MVASPGAVPSSVGKMAQPGGRGGGNKDTQRLIYMLQKIPKIWNTLLQTIEQGFPRHTLEKGQPSRMEFLGNQ